MVAKLEMKRGILDILAEIPYEISGMKATGRHWVR
jgi:hypothetical protein